MNQTLNSRRITSIDLLRGLVMIIMALDHVRDYFNYDAYIYDPTDLSRTNSALFLTRWITHFCAPVFVLLAGTSAFMSGQRKSKKELAVFLWTRGLWLIVLELLVVDFGWYFNPHFQFLSFQVIWALGLAMIILGVLIFLPLGIILTIGCLFVFGHNLLDNVHVAGHGPEAIFWSILHERRKFDFAHFSVVFAYPIIPWAGLMAIGYCLGFLYRTQYESQKRTRLLAMAGVGCLVLFVLIRSKNIYGDPFSWAPQSSFIFSLFSFVNVAKYPPSLDYLLITVGAALIFLSVSEKPLNRLGSILSTYGRVPLFFYILHIYIIHLGAVLALGWQKNNWHDMVNLKGWVTSLPQLSGYGFPLPVVYLIWILLVLALYPLCKWYDKYKSSHKENKWLSYL